MNHLPIEQQAKRDVQPPTRIPRGEPMSTRPARALGLGAAAVGAVALGATAIGRVRTLTVDHLDVRRLHVGTLTIDSGVPR
jgi:hypothetical protein